MAVMTDCNAFDKKHNCCIGLDETICKFGECKFYKSKEQFEEERIRVEIKLRKIGYKKRKNEK